MYLFYNSMYSICFEINDSKVHLDSLFKLNKKLSNMFKI